MINKYADFFTPNHARSPCSNYLTEHKITMNSTVQPSSVQAAGPRSNIFLYFLFTRSQLNSTQSLLYSNCQTAVAVTI